MKTQQSKENLVWIDLEMTGLDPERERIIEIADMLGGGSESLTAVQHAKQLLN